MRHPTLATDISSPVLALPTPVRPTRRALPLRQYENSGLVASGGQQGAWVVTGYGIAPAERTSFTAPASTEPSGQKCYYVLDVLLCD